MSSLEDKENSNHHFGIDLHENNPNIQSKYISSRSSSKSEDELSALIAQSFSQSSNSGSSENHRLVEMRKRKQRLYLPEKVGIYGNFRWMVAFVSFLTTKTYRTSICRFLLCLLLKLLQKLLIHSWTQTRFLSFPLYFCVDHFFSISIQISTIILALLANRIMKIFKPSIGNVILPVIDYVIVE